MLCSWLGDFTHTSHGHQKLDTYWDSAIYVWGRSRQLTMQANSLDQEGHTWDVHTSLHKLAWGWSDTWRA